LGQLHSGIVASLMGPGSAAVIGGAAVLLVVAAFAFNPNMRRPPRTIEDSGFAPAPG
jgi:hypothetical protein